MRALRRVPTGGGSRGTTPVPVHRGVRGLGACLVVAALTALAACGDGGSPAGSGLPTGATNPDGTPATSYPGQPYPGATPTLPGGFSPTGSSFPGQQFPGQQYPGQPFPGQSFPGQSFPGQTNPGSQGAAGSRATTTTTPGGRPAATTSTVAPTTTPTFATSTTLNYTPFACVARLISTVDQVPAGKRAVFLRVALTDGEATKGWWRIRYGSDALSGDLTFGTNGMAQTSTLVAPAGSTVTAEVFASGEYLPTSMACEARTTLAP